MIFYTVVLVPRLHMINHSAGLCSTVITGKFFPGAAAISIVLLCSDSTQEGGSHHPAAHNLVLISIQCMFVSHFCESSWAVPVSVV